jgi:hypothetical protein
MNYYIPVIATEVAESNTLFVHAIPNKQFSNKEAAEKHYGIKVWGSVGDYRKAKAAGWIIKFTQG